MSNLTPPQVIFRILIPLHLAVCGVALYFIQTVKTLESVEEPFDYQGDPAQDEWWHVVPESGKVYYNDGSETPFDPYDLFSTEETAPLLGWEDSGLLSADWGLYGATQADN